MINDFCDTNMLISEALQSNKPFSLIRIDNTASYVLKCLYNNQFPIEQYYNTNTLIESGIYPTEVSYSFNTVIPKTIDVMKKSDILGFVDISDSICTDVDFLSQFPNKPLFFNYWILDAGCLVGYSEFGKLENPWTKYLKGKRVLVVSSHAKTILQQWENIDKIWGDKKDQIVPFELVDAISTPFHPAIDSRQYANCNNFEDLVNITKSRIDQYDYDVLLTGVTTQSPFYADHAKNSGKVGIQLGGAIQMLFGILGEKWVINYNAYYNSPERLFNEHWIYPLKEDEPQRKSEISFLETSYAYWKR
jgi:hypothetical protein